MARPALIDPAQTTASETTARHEPQQGSATPVRIGLAAAVVELERAVARAEALQHSLSPFLRRGGEGIEAFQTLDDITQHLHGLGDFLAALARDCPVDWRLDLEQAGEPLRLHDQKLRLTRSGQDAPPPTASSGDLELW